MLWGGTLQASSSPLLTLHFSHAFTQCFWHSISMLSQSLMTSTFLESLFINFKFGQCPRRGSCQLQLFWYLQQTMCFCCISLKLAGNRTFNVMALKVCPHYAAQHTMAKCGKSCAMPQVYVDVASAWLWHGVRCCAA